MNPHVSATADVDDSATIGGGSRIWHLAQVRDAAVVGRDCVVGRGAYIGSGVVVGDNCKIQNYALVYEPARLGDGVFVGPAAVLTNDPYPRAVTPDGAPKTAGDWTAAGVTVADGASIGARAVCLPGVRIGRFAVVGAGAVVTKDVPDFALVIGNPARFHAWVGRAGVPLRRAGESRWECPRTGEVYRAAGDGVEPDES
ncbi:acetyltransferase-like isoleucine patch superfamily enzyme [Stackebrandtia albiflava]|uniref:Acetyltransferase-like isoleucine patch superfamily enzyme n=1 Tax=Stackebrandtia albiflava TaxID=406432 RepID=A0A562V350_9ACTN|nr:acyltransferase [Stackebrandtia albiflava]TWJ12329.1 acetyltransferase-like isoleucine patch superfamily enzyme [Stackebrandtia albiflava]